jgi:hypothetical protein
MANPEWTDPQDWETDPLEHIIGAALDMAGIDYVSERDGNPTRLDFGLTVKGDVQIEVKAWHSPRISDQMSRARNVIAVQGPDAVAFFAAMLLALPCAQQRRWKCLHCGHDKHVPWEAKAPEFKGRFVKCAACGVMHSGDRARELDRFTGCDSDTHRMAETEGLGAKPE